MKRKIYLLVLAVHIFCCLWIMISPAPLPKEATRGSLIVKTMPQASFKIETLKPEIKKSQRLAPQAQERKSPKKPKAVLPPPAVKASLPAQKSKSVKAKVSHPALPKSEPEKKIAPVIPQDLLRELEETIAKIDEKRDKLYSNKEKVAEKRESAGSVSRPLIQSGLEELNFQESLIRALKESLTLPDFGEVKIELTLRHDGSVEKLKVLSAHSEKNRKYLETNLSTLKFPSLLSSKEKELTFVITFCNEL
jgi:hypothetical protein